MKKLKGVLFLLIAALFWGVAFVAQDVGAETIQPFTFTATRYFMGGTTLLLLALMKDGIRNKKYGKPLLSKEEKKKNLSVLLLGGVVCGAVLTAATNLQQIGLTYTTAGKSGFITACYIVLVPVIGLFFKKKCPYFVWIAVGLTLVGLYFLCLADGFDGFNKGDLITLGCSASFAVHILCISHFVAKTDGIKLTCVQSFVCCAISAIPMFIFEKPDVNALLQAWLPLLYTGIFSAGLAYMFQTLGQKELSPTLSSIVMSSESVISVIAAWLILQQALTVKEIIGCVIIFAAIILAQLPQREKRALVRY